MKYGNILVDKKNKATKKNYGGNNMLKRIKEIVTEKEMERIDRVIANIYSIDDESNNSIAFQLGFDTVSNLNGRGYNNLVIVADRLNYGEEDEAFARFILNQVLPGDKVERLKKEVENNRNRYISILYLK